MQVLQTPCFAKQVKKLKPNQKQALDDAVRTILQDPLIGVKKHGDLHYLRVYKFSMLKQQALLAYSVDEERAIIKLLAVGPHENFYRDLKR